MASFLICGSRTFEDVSMLEHTLDVATSLKGPPDTVITGGARGADRLGGEWAIDRGFTHIEVMADWKNLGRRAGMVRNEWMADMLDHESIVFAFLNGPLHKSKGTRSMCNIAAKRGISTLVRGNELMGEGGNFWRGAHALPGP